MTTQETELIRLHEQSGSEESLKQLTAACRRNPELLQRLAERNRELARAVQEYSQVLTEAKEALEAREKGERQVVAFIDAGPRDASGRQTALIDKGGNRAVAPLGEGVKIDALYENPAALLDQEGVVVGVLEGYEPPAEEGRVFEAGEVGEAGQQRVTVEFHADEKVRLDVRRDLRGELREGDRALVDRRTVRRAGAQEDTAQCG